eukprot:4434926-Pyramimonas_sp.AAC.1
MDQGPGGPPRALRRWPRPRGGENQCARGARRRARATALADSARRNKMRDAPRQPRARQPPPTARGE